MNPNIYQEVKGVAVDLANASAVDDVKAQWSHYQKLQQICIENENGENNHPFQWEALGDFTSDNNLALEIYQNALDLALRLKLDEYSASINLAMAERYRDLGDKEKAHSFAAQADVFANKLDILELRKEVSEFLLDICQ